jgi:phosphatidylserine decarboxylase
MAWFSTIEQPVIRDLSLWIWQLFGGDLNLHEARKTTFASVHDCFIRELRDGARPIDSTPGILVSPCDAIVGECGAVEAMQLVQAKGFTYSLEQLLLNRGLAESYRSGRYVTLRLTSTMYHRFHAPADCEIEEVRYVPGDTWNVNPATLKRVRNVFCRNERAVITVRLVESPHSVTLVPIAAILVGGIRLTAADVTFNLTYTGPERIVCRHPLQRGQEMGLFNHGSTVVVLASDGCELCEDIRPGHRIRVGEPLLRLEINRPMMPDVCNRHDT